MRKRGIIALAALVAATAANAAERVEVLSTPGCGCCLDWIEHMRSAGFETATERLATDDLDLRKAEAGLKPERVSCHTAFVAGYVVEGHVPAADVRRLLAERPDAVGLAVPGMPEDAPGMGEGDGTYDVVLVARDGSFEVWSTWRGATKVSGR